MQPASWTNATTTPLTPQAHPLATPTSTTVNEATAALSSASDKHTPSPQEECYSYQQQSENYFLIQQWLEKDACQHSAAARHLSLIASLQEQCSLDFSQMARSTRLRASLGPTNKESSLCQLLDGTAKQHLLQAQENDAKAQIAAAKAEQLTQAAALAGKQTLFYAKNKALLHHRIEQRLENLKTTAQKILEEVAYATTASANLDNVASKPDANAGSDSPARLTAVYHTTEALYRKAGEEFELKRLAIQNSMKQNENASFPSWSDFESLELRALAECYQEAADLCLGKAREASGHTT